MLIDAGRKEKGKEAREETCVELVPSLWSTHHNDAVFFAHVNQFFDFLRLATTSTHLSRLICRSRTCGDERG